MTSEPTIPSHSPYVPVNPTVGEYMTIFGHLTPVSYTGTKDETMSWKETCYIHGGLNPIMPYRVSGPDATRLLNEVCVNKFDNIKIGKSTHAVLCAPTGNIVAHGMALRLAEDDWMTYHLAPPLAYHATSGRYDIEYDDLSRKAFVFQVAGPRSLEVLETALGQDLREIPYLGHRQGFRLAEAKHEDDLQILRIGMAGVLSYEIGGSITDAHTVYNEILRVGEAYGIRQFSFGSWPLQHAQNGFVQAFSHFPAAWAEDPQLEQWLREKLPHAPIVHTNLKGSMGPDPAARYCNPVDIGWGHIVRIKKEGGFIGRDALAPLKENPTKKMVTLEWNVDDILDTYREQFGSEEPCDPIAFPIDDMHLNRAAATFNDKVLKDGKFIGMSMGRHFSHHYRQMISICPIDVEHSELGTEVDVLWGDPGTPQRNIRATVARYPYLDMPRNEEIDVTELPRVLPDSAYAD